MEQSCDKKNESGVAGMQSLAKSIAAENAKENTKEGRVSVLGNFLGYPTVRARSTTGQERVSDRSSNVNRCQDLRYPFYIPECPNMTFNFGIIQNYANFYPKIFVFHVNQSRFVELIGELAEQTNICWLARHSRPFKENLA